MAEAIARLRRFFAELKRRNVYQVAVTYAVVGFVLIEAASLIFPALNIPSWAYSLVVVLVLFGFPIALVIAWAFEMTPEGVERTPDAGEPVEPASAGPATRGLPGWIVVLAIAALAGAGMWYLAAAGGGASSGAIAAASDSVRGEPDGSTRPASRDRPFVAVLPLENLSSEEENAFFADGIHEEVINQLSKVSGLRVRPRTSVRQYEGTEKTMQEIARELNVQALVEGSVRRAAGRVRISAQLFDARSGDPLWSDSYERELSPEAIFEVQADIAEQITGALETRLTEDERRRIEDAPTDDLTAYDEYLKGRTEVWRFYGTLSPVQIDRAMAHFREAGRRDPGFAEAHARLADAYRMRRTWHSRDPRWLDSIDVALERARATDREVPEIHWVQGFVYTDQDSLEAAAGAFRRALDLEPSNSIACSGLSTVRSRQGRLPASVRWAHRAYRLEPDRPFRRGEMGARLRDIGMLDLAEAWFRSALELDPDDALTVMDLGLTRALTEPEHALTTMAAFLDRHPDHPAALFEAARYALLAGHPARTRSYLDRIPGAPGPMGWVSWPEPMRFGVERRMLLGLAELRLGNRERGRELLVATTDTLRRDVEQDDLTGPLDVLLAGALMALEEREEALRYLRPEAGASLLATAYLVQASPLVESLRPEPRYQELIRQVEAKHEEFREEVLRMDLDLYPPGWEAEGTAGGERPSDG